jgi:hypothetical protein
MAAISTIYTLRHVAKAIGEDEEFVWETAIEMEPEDGCIQIRDDQFSDDDDWPIATGFTDFGVDNLVDLIAEIRRHRRQSPGASSTPKS